MEGNGSFKETDMVFVVSEKLKIYRIQELEMIDITAKKQYRYLKSAVCTTYYSGRELSIG